MLHARRTHGTVPRHLKLDKDLAVGTVEKWKVMEVANKQKDNNQISILFKSHKPGVGGLIQTLGSANRHKVKKSITTKATRILNLLKRSMSGCSQHAKATACPALVHPHLEYCAPVWDPHTVKNVEMLEKVQKWAARWLIAKWESNSKQWDKSYFQSLSELNWQSLQQQRTYLNQCQTS